MLTWRPPLFQPTHIVAIIVCVAAGQDGLRAGLRVGRLAQPCCPCGTNSCRSDCCRRGVAGAAPGSSLSHSEKSRKSPLSFFLDSVMGPHQAHVADPTRGRGTPRHAHASVRNHGGVPALGAASRNRHCGCWWTGRPMWRGGNGVAVATSRPVHKPRGRGVTARRQRGRRYRLCERHHVTRAHTKEEGSCGGGDGSGGGHRRGGLPGRPA
jgi:hypothetical protein